MEEYMTDEATEERFRNKIDDLQEEGWKLEKRENNRAVLVKHRYGGLGGHILIFLLTSWWTFFLGNVAYAAYNYFTKSEKRIIRKNEIK